MVEQVRAGGPAIAYRRKSGLKHAWPHVLQACQLGKYREEVGGLPPAQDVERWKQNGPDSDDLPKVRLTSSLLEMELRLRVRMMCLC